MILSTQTHITRQKKNRGKCTFFPFRKITRWQAPLGRGETAPPHRAAALALTPARRSAKTDCPVIILTDFDGESP